MLIKALNSQLSIIPQENDGGGQGEGDSEENDTDTNDTNEENGGEGDSDGDEDDQDGQNGDGDDTDEGDTDTDGDGTDENDGEDGEDGDGKGEKGEDEGEEEGDGDGQDGENGKEGEDPGDNPINKNPTDQDGEGDNEGKGDDQGDGEFVDYRDWEQGDEKEEKSAGGAAYVDKDDAEQEKAIADMLETLLEQMEEAGEEDIDLKGHNESFTEHFEGMDNDVLEGEQVWRPFYPERDTIRLVSGGKKDVAKKYQKKVRGEVASIAAKLRTKFLLARSVKTIHGVRNGKDLSERRLVNSMVEIRSGRRPTRPDWNRVQRDDCTLAVGLVIDQSGSMGGSNCAYATQGAIAISEALDKLGAPIMVCGPRDGGWTRPDYEGKDEADMYAHGANSYYTESHERGYHRTQAAVTIDLFKDWEERMNKALPRFSKITATGGTPLSDGIQFAMQELSERTERYRVIIVLTDGAANCPAVVTRQIRLCKEAGIHVIGVGIGSGCSAVETQFPANYIQIPDVRQLPKQLLTLLDRIMFPKRAKKARMDGKIGR